MSARNTIEPQEVVDLVEGHADEQVRRVGEYENCDFFDNSAMFDLHRIAAQIYALGHEAGERAATEKWRRGLQRDLDVAARARKNEENR